MSIPEWKKWEPPAGQNLCTSIRKGRFTPFLGAGAASLRAKTVGQDTPAWAEAAARLARLLEALEPVTKGYVEGIAKANGLDSGADPGPVQSRVGAALLAMQIDLAKLGSYLVGEVGAQMTETRAPVTQLESYDVVLPTTPQYLPEYLCDALDSAKALRQEVKRADLGDEASEEVVLAPTQIYDRLAALAAALLGREGCERAEIREHAHHQKLLELIEETPPEPEIRVRLEQLEWMSGLLWHTLRYDVPAYPTASELAFWLSLWAELDPRSADLAEAAQWWEDIFKDEELIEKMTSWFQRARGKESKELKSFYDALAAALLVEFRGWAKKRRKLQKELQQRVAQQRGRRTTAQAAMDADNGVLRVPLVVTTNYDHCLEDAFARLGRSCHVFMPVREGDSLRWVVRSQLFEDQQRYDDEWGDLKYDEAPDSEAQVQDPHPLLISPLGAEDEDWRPIEFELQGPIIVKIHGSLMDDLGKNVGPDVQPFIVLSEEAYLATMVQSQVPKWVEVEMRKSRRDVYFLGYSLSDWNIRLSLFRQVQWLESSQGKEPPTRKSLYRRKDRWRSLLLGALNIEPYEGELTKVDRDIRACEEVERILGGSL